MTQLDHSEPPREREKDRADRSSVPAFSREAAQVADEIARRREAEKASREPSPEMPF